MHEQKHPIQKVPYGWGIETGEWKGMNEPKASIGTRPPEGSEIGFYSKGV